MNTTKLASGDNNKNTQETDMKGAISPEIIFEETERNHSNEVMEENKEKQDSQNTITPTTIEKNDANLKERVEQCKNIIASLKLELNGEKNKLEKEFKQIQLQSNDPPHRPTSNNANSTEKFLDSSHSANNYSDYVDSKLTCDENLMEYEKQLQRYQNTLNMAQIEKKNAIRKQMLAKAFKLKLMEVENQCNIELLRIKQSLQCLEPLQMIAGKWDTNTTDNVYDLNNFELIPRYPESNATSGSDITNFSAKDDSEDKIAITNL